MDNKVLEVKEWRVNVYHPKPPTKHEIFETVLIEPSKLLDNRSPIKSINYNCPLNSLTLEVRLIPTNATHIDFDPGEYTNSTSYSAMDRNASIDFYDYTMKENPSYGSELELYNAQERIFQEQLGLYPEKLQLAKDEQDKFNNDCKLRIEARKKEEAIKKEEDEKLLYLKLKEKYEPKIV